MTGPKLNEGVLLLAANGQGPVSTKATARYLRGSASKARAVLDLIRGLDVRRADEVLQFTERGAAADVRKVLASAVANAIHNDAQDAEELFVLACFADEGPTLKRFRPRARGRASRIRKRTCHITVIVARMSDERLEVVQARQAASTGAGRRPGTSAQSRRDRVARSRARAEGLREGTGDTTATVDNVTTDELVDEVIDDGDDTDIADDTVVEEAPEGDPQDVADVADNADSAAQVADGSAEFVSAETPKSDRSADTNDSDAAADLLPAGAVAAPEDGSVPEGYPIKGNTNSMKYHEPDGRYYDVTIAELYFDTPERAEAAGYEAPGGANKASDETDSETASAPDRSDDETETGVASASDELPAQPDASASEPEKETK